MGAAVGGAVGVGPGVQVGGAGLLQGCQQGAETAAGEADGLVRGADHDPGGVAAVERRRGEQGGPGVGALGGEFPGAVELFGEQIAGVGADLGGAAADRGGGGEHGDRIRLMIRQNC